MPHAEPPAQAVPLAGDAGTRRGSPGRRWGKRQLALNSEVGGSAGEVGAPTHHSRSSFPFVCLALAVVGGVVILVLQGIAGGDWAGVAVRSVVVWVALCAAANLLQVPASRNLTLSMSAPVNIAIATVLPVGVAVAVVAVGSLSLWELERATRLSHAVFNRCQLALSAAAAGWALDAPLTSVPSAGRAVGAVVAYELANWVLVGTAERAARGTLIRDVVRRILPPRPVAAVVYLALGVMGVALGMAAVRVGLWAVALLMFPLLGARQAVSSSRALEQAERERRLLADRLVDERERERLRIAGDLHDVVLQQLAAVRLQADNVASAIAAGNGALATDLVASTSDTVDRTIADLRRSVASLRRTTLDAAGLVPTLERYGRGFATQSGIEVAVRAEGLDESGIATTTALLLYETCQEALANVARHADAQRVSIELALSGRMLSLSIVDDGQGFDPPAVPPGMGLALIEDKVSLAGGSLSVTSSPGTGTRLVVAVPVGAPA